jgi:hypothetical protein
MNHAHLETEPQIIAARDARRDAMFLFVVVAVSSVLYVRGLGFYSDDWAFLGVLANSPNQSLFEVACFLYEIDPNTYTRPLQIFYLALLYKLFGIQPLGYHIVNGSVFAGMILLFYFALRELRVPRVLAVSVPLVYALLPHYSTDRFWVAAFQANLSIGFYFLSLYASVKTLRARAPYPWALLVISGLLGSALAYEVVLPLFLLNIPVIWFAARRIGGLEASASNGRMLRFRLLSLSLSIFIALVSSVAFKSLASNRTGLKTDFVTHAVRIGTESFAVNYIGYGLLLPKVAWVALSQYSNKAIIFIGGTLTLIIFGYLYHIARSSQAEPIARNLWLKIVVLGFGVFFSGYAVFLVTSEVDFHKTGIVNRTAIAAALGVAVSFIGALGLTSSLLSSASLRAVIFTMGVALLCACGFIINNTIATFWIAAYDSQQEVLGAIHRQFPVLSPGNTLILDGVCPNVGPATVFDLDYDLRGALWLRHRTRDLQADVVKPTLRIEETGLTTKSTFGVMRHYPYSENLLVYHFGRNVAWRLTDAKAARAYFETFGRDFNGNCSELEASGAVAVF